jgi:hypothetical protein
MGSAVVLAKKLLGSKRAKPEPMSRADFLAEMLDMRERLQANHLALLGRLDANRREFLATLERQGARVTALEGGFAHLDKRTQR